jgi:hypothetical protein
VQLKAPVDMSVRVVDVGFEPQNARFVVIPVATVVPVFTWKLYVADVACAGVMGRTASARITIARIATILWKEGLVRVFVFMILLRIFVGWRVPAEVDSGKWVLFVCSPPSTHKIILMTKERVIPFERQFLPDTY